MILPLGILMVGLHNPQMASEKTKKLQSYILVGDGWNILNTLGYLSVVMNLQPPTLAVFLKKGDYMRKLLIISSLVALSACVQAVTLKTVDEVEEAITCTEDDFSGVTSCDLPLKHTCSIDGSDSYMHCAGYNAYSRLKLTHKNNQDAQFGISGYIWSSQWTFPERALDSDGEKIAFENTDSIPSCTTSTCRYKEYFVMYLDKNYLNAHKDTGISIKIYGKRGTARVVFPAQYVQGMLNYANKNEIK